MQSPNGEDGGEELEVTSGKSGLASPWAKPLWPKELGRAGALGVGREGKRLFWPHWQRG